eukprot:7665702-Pyramimonas_sp.AAC.1
MPPVLATRLMSLVGHARAAPDRTMNLPGVRARAAPDRTMNLPGHLAAPRRSGALRSRSSPAS